jgi:transcriptional antiterminator NusG
MVESHAVGIAGGRKYMESLKDLTFSHWYALFVKSNCEESVRRYISEHIPEEFGYAALVPRRFMRERRQGAWYEVNKVMFPGYVLVGTDNIAGLYSTIRQNDKILSLLRNDDGYAEIELSEIAHIVYMSDEVGVIGESDIFIEGETVLVKSGPLANFDGVIAKVQKRNKRCIVRFQFNGETHEIELCTNILTAISDEEYLGLKEIAIER